MTKTVHFVIADDSNVDFDLDKDTLGLMFVCALCLLAPVPFQRTGGNSNSETSRTKTIGEVR